MSLFKGWFPNYQQNQDIVLIFSLIMLGNSLAQKVAEIASISSFLNNVGVAQFLVVLIISSVISIGITGVQSLLIDRFNRLQIISGITIFLGLSFTILRLLFLMGTPGWLNYSLFYLLSDQQFTSFPLIFWVFANDMFEMSEAKQVFPIITSFSFWGSLIGIGIAAISPRILNYFGIPLEEVLTLNAIIYLILFILIRLGLRKVNLHKKTIRLESLKDSVSEGWEFIQQVPAFRYLAISGLAIIICENILDFHFFAISESFFQDAGSYQTFLGIFTLVRVVAYLAIQTFIVQKLMNNFSLKNLFMVMPISSFLGIISALALPGISGSILSVSLQKLPQYTLDDVAKKSFQGFVPEEKRGRVSAFMDSYLVAAGAILGALITGIVILGGQFLGFPDQVSYIYLGLALLVAAIATFTGAKLRIHYESSLLNWRLKRRKRSKNILDKLDF
jgi:ATP/ADP translocase